MNPASVASSVEAQESMPESKLNELSHARKVAGAWSQGVCGVFCATFGFHDALRIPQQGRKWHPKCLAFRTSQIAFWQDIESSFGSLAAFFVRRCFRCLLVLSLRNALHALLRSQQPQPQASYLGMVLCTVTLWRLPQL